MMNTFRTISLALIAGLFLATGSVEIAKADGTVDIKARKATMKAIGGHMGGIKLALKGKGHWLVMLKAWRRWAGSMVAITPKVRKWARLRLAPFPRFGPSLQNLKWQLTPSLPPPLHF